MRRAGRDGGEGGVFVATAQRVIFLLSIMHYYNSVCVVIIASWNSFRVSFLLHFMPLPGGLCGICALRS